ncbi:hypothetical protein SNE40_021594 [Patella caerulea]|uniref:Uncharacterized protein n=1 Tax=Patella caerulea TaxID=87958 RepID=A0AAN8IWV7_PATCE
MAENLPPSTSQQLKSETESAPASLSRTTSIKGILKTRSESQLILKVPIKDPERQSIITKFENGAASDNESLASVRFALETEVGDEPPNPKRKRKNTGKPKPASTCFYFAMHTLSFFSYLQK